MKDLVKIGNSFNIPLKTYIADFEEDLDIILKEEKPPVGSIVEVINTGIYKKYKLGNDLKWYEIPIESSGGGCNPEDYKLQEKRVVPSTAAQIVTPDANYYGLSKVNVNKIPENYITTDDANATPEDLMIGKTAYVQGQKITGTKEDETYVLPLASENELGGIKASEKDELDVQECKINTENGKLYTQSFEDLLIVDKIEGNHAISGSSAEWRVPLIEGYGESKQFMTQGNQLFDISKFKSTASQTNNLDGSITLLSYSPNVAENKLTDVLPNVKIGDVIYIDFKSSLTSHGGLIYIGNAVVSKKQKIDITEEMISKNWFGFYGMSDNSQVVISDIIFSHELGTSYEPYTGGAPSPSPEYPQEIKSSVVTGVKVTGKNLLNFTKETTQTIRLSWGAVPGTEIGFTTDNANYSKITQIQVKPNTSYSFFNETNSDFWVSRLIEADDNDFGYVNHVFYRSFTQNKKPYSFTTNAKTTKIFFQVWTPDQTEFKDEYFDKMQIAFYQGNYSYYEPYKEQSIQLSTPIVLRGIPSKTGNVTIDGQKYLSDYIGQKEGVYGVFRKTQEKILNGSEFWQSIPSINVFVANSVFGRVFNQTDGICNQLIVNGSTSPKAWIGSNNAHFYAVDTSFFDDNLPDYGLENWKTHLAENPLKIITVADEETFEPLPEQDSKALSNLKTFYPTSIISGVTEDNTGIWIQTDIVCDPKNYINNEITKITNEVQTQLLATNKALLEEI